MEQKQQNRSGADLQSLMKQEQNYEGMDLQSLIKLQSDLATKLADIKAKGTAVSKQLDYLRNAVIPDKMEDEGIDGITVSGVGRVSLFPVMRVSVKSGKSAELQEWLKEEDAGDLIKPNVNSSTLKAYISERIQNGEDYPDEVLNIHAFSQSRITKLTKDSPPVGRINNK